MGIGDFFNKIKFKFYLKINFINFNINNGDWGLGIVD